MFGCLTQPVEDPFADPGGNEGQERREAQVDHALAARWQWNRWPFPDDRGSEETPLPVGRGSAAIVLDSTFETPSTATQNCEAFGSGSTGMGPDSARVIRRWRYQAAIS